MAYKVTVRKWTDLRGLPVTIPGEGRKVGTVEDFYFKLEVNSVYALRVNAGVYGYRALMASAISAIRPDAVTIPNENMLIDERNDGQLPVFPLGSTLFGRKVVSESGAELGIIRNILLAIDPPVALHIESFQLDGGRIVSAEEVTDYAGDTVFILDQAAKRLR